MRYKKPPERGRFCYSQRNEKSFAWESTKEQELAADSVGSCQMPSHLLGGADDESSNSDEKPGKLSSSSPDPDSSSQLLVVADLVVPASVDDVNLRVRFFTLVTFLVAPPVVTNQSVT